jgi:DNA-binding MarR family transcriptional regulator
LDALLGHRDATARSAAQGHRSICCGLATDFDNIRYNEYPQEVAKSIQSEIQQTKPFSTLEEEALVSLQRTADQLHWRMSEMLKEHGVSPTQYNALRILRGAKDEGRACSEIAERMINRDPDITRLVDRLERRGLVARSREDRDRRVITTRITPAGLKLLDSLDRPIEDFNRRLLGPLGEQRLRTLIQLLDAAREHSK